MTSTSSHPKPCSPSLAIRPRRDAAGAPRAAGPPRIPEIRPHRATDRSCEEVGGSNVRVFGSVATGKEREGSDIDLLADLSRTELSLFGLERLQHQPADVVGVPVDLTPDSGLRPHLRDRVLAEASPL